MDDWNKDIPHLTGDGADVSEFFRQNGFPLPFDKAALYRLWTQDTVPEDIDPAAVSGSWYWDGTIQIQVDLDPSVIRDDVTAMSLSVRSWMDEKGKDFPFSLGDVDGPYGPSEDTFVAFFYVTLGCDKDRMDEAIEKLSGHAPSPSPQRQGFQFL